MSIERFRNEYYFLANSYYLTDIELNGKIYPSAEHAFQAAKCADTDDRAIDDLLCLFMTFWLCTLYAFTVNLSTFTAANITSLLTY